MKSACWVLCGVVLISCTSGMHSACERAYAALRNNCGQPSTQPENPGDKDRYIAHCESVTTLPNTGWTTSKFEECTKAFEACDTYQWPASCRVTGTLADGAPCSDGTQCSGGECAKTHPNPCGVCKTPLPLGAPCDQSTSDCGAGAGCFKAVPTDPTDVCTAYTYVKAGASCGQTTYCDLGFFCDTSKTCVAKHDLGAACTGQQECKDGLVCSGSKCATPPAEGQPCPDYQCATGICDSVTKICKPITYVDSGECDATHRCKVGYCNMPTGTTGTCPTVIADGQPCNVTDDNSRTCNNGASCIKGICTTSAEQCK